MSLISSSTTITDSEIDDCTASAIQEAEGGALRLLCEGVAKELCGITLDASTIRRCAVHGNQTALGGAIALFKAVLVMQRRAWLHANAATSQNGTAGSSTLHVEGVSAISYILPGVCMPCRGPSLCVAPALPVL